MFTTFVDIGSYPSLRFGWYLSWVQKWLEIKLKVWLEQGGLCLQERTAAVSGLRCGETFSPFTAQTKFCYKLAQIKWLCSPVPDRYSLWPCPQVGSWSTDLGCADKKMSSTISMQAGVSYFHTFVWGWSFTTLQFISRHPEANVLWICIFHDWFLNTAHIGT